jgi:pimeloyl-ACP methyl ester carboxylesterase
MSDTNTEENIIEQHEAAGRFIQVGGIKTFVLDQGSGEAVFCIHGVPTSSFLYRKVLQELAGKGFRGVALDLPWLGLSDRPEDFDYSFPNFARFCAQATEVLGLDQYHLVIHDIGGPIGFALAAENQDRILSLTILNSWIDVVNFQKPLPMRPFEKPVLGEGQLALTNHTTWQLMFNSLGLESNDRISKEEINAYVDLLKREDGGKAFLKIMRSFNHSEEFRALCYRAVQNVPYPVQAVWGAEDPALTMEEYGKEIQEAAGLEMIHTLPARHFLQEEQWEAIADRVAEIARQAAGRRNPSRSEDSPPFEHF